MYHKSVLLKEVLQALNVQKGKWYLDATLGDGGHSLAILQAGGNVVGIDVDPEALERVRKRFEKEKINKEKYILIQGNFREIKQLLGDKKFSGIIFDLGVSSLQFDEVKRGFSFMKDAPLDMRMDPSLKVTAADLINGLNKGELIKLFLTLGEERQAKKVTELIISNRPISTTMQLAKIIYVHPAKVFQALRIAVNDELNSLKEALPQALELLDLGGMIIVISFHSLEDRIVKHFFKSKNLITPSDEEIKLNPRSRSAKMRVFKKYALNT